MHRLRWIRWTLAAVILMEIAAFWHTAAGVPSVRAQKAARFGFAAAGGVAPAVHATAFSGPRAGDVRSVAVTPPARDAWQLPGSSIA